MERQIDYLLDASAARLTMNSRLLADIERRLPQTATISVTDVALAIPVSRDVVYAWIDCGAVETLDVRGAAQANPERHIEEGRKRCNRIGRDSLLSFLKTLLEKG